MSDTHGHYITIPGLYVLSDISAKQYHAVKHASTADAVVALGATTNVIAGVLMDAPDAAGEAAMVARLGVVTVVAGTGTLARGTQIQFDSTGRAITASGKTYGQLLESKSAIGDELRAILY